MAEIQLNQQCDSQKWNIWETSQQIERYQIIFQTNFAFYITKDPFIMAGILPKYQNYSQPGQFWETSWQLATLLDLLVGVGGWVVVGVGLRLSKLYQYWTNQLELSLAKYGFEPPNHRFWQISKNCYIVIISQNSMTKIIIKNGILVIKTKRNCILNNNDPQ